MLLVRQMHPSEFPLLMAHSCQTAWAQRVPRQQPGDFATTMHRNQEMWWHAFKQGGTVLILASEEQASPLGYILLAPFHNPFGGSPEMIILDIWVDPEVRGQGAGARLLTAAEDYAGRRGFAGVIAQVALHNRSSLGLFTGAGYAIERAILGKRVSPGTAP